MSNRIIIKQYDDDHLYYYENKTDTEGDPIDDNEMIRTLQKASKQLLMNAIRSNTVIKVTTLRPHQNRIRGYATFEKYLLGKTPQQFENMLGLRNGALKGGCRIYTLDSLDFTEDNIGPRYYTNWPAGMPPIEHKGNYHRDFPPASDPIPQFVIFNPVKVITSQVLQYGQRLDSL